MARSDQALVIEALWDETERLNQAVAELQARLSVHEGSNAHAWIAASDSSTAPALTLQDSKYVWNVWPYSWAITFYAFCANHFHSFQRDLFKRDVQWPHQQVSPAGWNYSGQEDSQLKLI